MQLDKKTAIIIVLCLAVFISIRLTIAFNQIGKSAEEKTPAFTVDLPATYSGTIPCGSCPGIEYSLQLSEDEYTESLFYIDRDPEPVIIHGNWEAKGDSVLLNPEIEQEKKYFLVYQEEAYMLNSSREKITGEHAEMYRLDRAGEEISIHRHLNRLKQEGIDFTASGNEPFWSVQADFENEILYRTPDSEIRFPAFQPGSSSAWNLESNGHSLQLSINEEPCRDSMSGFLFTHSVTVQLNGENEMSGCGMFLSSEF